MQFRPWSATVVVILIFAASTGCSKDAKHGTVVGTVTLNGQPLPTGIIRFIPADGKTPSADAPITDGKFSVVVATGEKKVSISAPRVVGKRKMYNTADSPTVDVVEELLPAQFNVDTTLTLSVASGTQQPAFELKSGS
jgi:hypothetical protein